MVNEAFELLYGGAAGGGKSVGLLASAALGVHRPDFAAILFRRTYKQLSEAGGLEPRSQEIYPHMGGTWKAGYFGWMFPAGSRVVFRHLQHPSDKYSYQGSEYPFVGFDQVEQFEEDSYLYLFSRVRSRDKRIRPLVRATANPGAEWVLNRWLPWLGTDDELSAKGWPRAKPGEILWFKRVEDEDVLTTEDDPDALSRTFIPATIFDNPTLMENDPGYLRRLAALPFVERRRLLNSDWHIKEMGGLVFQRIWWKEFRDSPAPMVRIVRAFDLAGSEKEVASDDPDYTATVKMGLQEQILVPAGEGERGIKQPYYWFLDADQQRLTPLRVEQLILHYHEIEPLSVIFAFEQEPGQSGKAQIIYYKRLLRGRRVVGVPSQKDKVERSGALSSDLEAGFVIVLRAAWNASFINHMVNFPDPAWHDDWPDAANLGHHALTSAPGRAKVLRAE